MKLIDKVLSAFEQNRNTLESLIRDHDTAAGTVKVAEEMVKCLNSEGKILICGNGGSAADAMHFAEELVGRFRHDRPALPALPLTDPAFVTCIANDYGFDHVFARGVEALGKSGDILVGISTSGNSDNVVMAAAKAREQGMTVIGLLGKDGGNLISFCDLSIVVPGETTDRIQEMHGLLIHVIIEIIERILFPENYRS